MRDLSQRPRIVSVGIANPGKKLPQNELTDKMGIHDKRISRLFKNAHINSRFLTLKENNGHYVDEPESELLDKHLKLALEAGSVAIKAALAKVHLQIFDIEYLCVVTSTGFMSPGLSAHLINELKIPMDCQRTDVVGMGCCAGLNGLNVTANWAQANPKKYALLLCVEICSAAYIFDDTIETAIVNSLFGDGAAAVILKAGGNEKTPAILGFSSYLIEGTLDAMQYVWNSSFNKFSFRLERAIPYNIGSHLETPVNKLLRKFNVKRETLRTG